MFFSSPTETTETLTNIIVQMPVASAKLTLSPIKTALGHPKTMNGRVH